MMTQDDIRIVEVGPRDGLQNLKRIVATEDKIGLIRRLAASGVREIQAGGFVNPRAIPQFHDMKAVMAGLGPLGEVVLNAMVPNLQGARDAIDSGLKKLVFFFSVSRSHNLNNVRQTPEASLASLRAITGELLGGSGVAIRVDLATVFGCPFEGMIDTDTILGYIDQVAVMGVREMTLCDTVGFGHPKQVEEIVSRCMATFPEITFGGHFHNTRGLGLANALRAYDMGIRSFDAAIGGLGGCPFAPGASGNVATEDMAFMFGRMGLDTGIDLPKLLETAHFLQTVLPEVRMASALFHAGLPTRFEYQESTNDHDKGVQSTC